MSLPAYKHAQTPPRPRADYLPDGAAPASVAEEVDLVRTLLPPWLTEGERFVTWVRHPDPVRQRWTKLPLEPCSPGRYASATGRRSWGRLEEAIACRRRFGLDGIARALVASDAIVSGDLDEAVLESGDLTPPAREAVATLPGYFERSPGGAGVRFFQRGVFPEPGRQGRKHGKLELYSDGRFMTITCRMLRAEREADPGALDGWYRTYLPPAPAPGIIVPRPDRPRGLPLSDEELLGRAFAARNGAAVRALWDGSTAAHGGDHSRADAALVSHLMWWTGNDAARTDALFRRSALWRPKWDQRHYSDGRTYGQGVVDHIRGVGGGYAGGRR